MRYALILSFLYIAAGASVAAPEGYQCSTPGHMNPFFGPSSFAWEALVVSRMSSQPYEVILLMRPSNPCETFHTDVAGAAHGPGSNCQQRTRTPQVRLMVEYPRKPAPKEDSNGSLIEYHPNKKPKGDAAGIWLGYGDGTSHLRDVGPDFPKHKSDYQPVDAKKFTDTPGYVAHRIYYTMPSTNRKTQPTEQRVVINVANYDAYAQWDYMFCVNGRGSETGVFRNH